MSKIAFDVEMTDHNEGDDVTTVRVTRSDDNRPICTANIAFGGNGDMSVSLIEQDKIPFDSVSCVEEAIAEAVQAELTTFQSGPNGHQIETLRDLFAVVVPSGMVRPLSVGYVH